MMHLNPDAEKKDDEMPFQIDEEKIRADLVGNGVKVDKVQIQTGSDMRDFLVYLSFDNITNLNNTRTFKNMPFEYSKEKNVYTFKHLIHGKPIDPNDRNAEAELLGKQMASAVLSGAKFTFKVKLPSKVLPAPDTNGKILEDGRTVTWEYPIADIGHGEKIMEVKFKAGLSWIWFLAAGAAFVLFATAVIIIMVYARRS